MGNKQAKAKGKNRVHQDIFLVAEMCPDGVPTPFSDQQLFDFDVPRLDPERQQRRRPQLRYRPGYISRHVCGNVLCLQRTIDCTETPHECCHECKMPFDDGRLRMCLPCKVGDGTMVRHCVLCEACLQRLLQSANGDHVSCPTCHQRFEIKELRKALRQGCLKFPSHVPPNESCSELTGYNDHEERAVPRKRQCLYNLRRAPLIAEILPKDSISQYKDRYYGHIQRILESRQNVMGRWSTYLERLKKFSRVQDVETVREMWGLQYQGSAPFPTNMDEIVAGCWF